MEKVKFSKGGTLTWKLKIHLSHCDAAECIYVLLYERPAVSVLFLSRINCNLICREKP